MKVVWKVEPATRQGNDQRWYLQSIHLSIWTSLVFWFEISSLFSYISNEINVLWSLMPELQQFLLNLTLNRAFTSARSALIQRLPALRCGMKKVKHLQSSTHRNRAHLTYLKQISIYAKIWWIIELLMFSDGCSYSILALFFNHWFK